MYRINVYVALGFPCQILNRPSCARLSAALLRSVQAHAAAAACRRLSGGQAKCPQGVQQICAWPGEQPGRTHGTLGALRGWLGTTVTPLEEGMGHDQA